MFHLAVLPVVTWRCCPDLTIDATPCRYGRGEAAMGREGGCDGGRRASGRGRGRWKGGGTDKEGVHVRPRGRACVTD